MKNRKKNTFTLLLCLAVIASLVCLSLIEQEASDILLVKKTSKFYKIGAGGPSKYIKSSGRKKPDCAAGTDYFCPDGNYNYNPSIPFFSISFVAEKAETKHALWSRATFS